MVDRRGVSQDEQQLDLHLAAFSYTERATLLADLGTAVDGAGGWMLDRRQISAHTFEMCVEVQQQCLPELYAALLSGGLELTRESHRVLAERCNCCNYLPSRRGASTIMTLRIAVQLLSDPQGAATPTPRASLRPATA